MAAGGGEDFNPRPPCGGRRTFNVGNPCSRRISIHVLRVEDDFILSSAKMEGRETHFNPRPPCGGRRAARGSARGAAGHFNPRPPCGGRLSVYIVNRQIAQISIHVLRVEDDHACASLRARSGRFQSTSSVWRTTGTLYAGDWHIAISIHVLRVEDDVARVDLRNRINISIHVLRVEDD